MIPYSPFQQPSSGIVRHPGNGLLGKFDHQEVMNYLRSKYPDSSDTDLMSMANAQIAQHQAMRQSALGQNSNISMIGGNSKFPLQSGSSVKTSGGLF